MKVTTEGGHRVMTEACHNGRHDQCSGVTNRADKYHSPTPCECSCHAPGAA